MAAGGGRPREPRLPRGSDAIGHHSKMAPKEQGSSFKFVRASPAALGHAGKGGGAGGGSAARAEAALRTRRSLSMPPLPLHPPALPPLAASARSTPSPLARAPALPTQPPLMGRGGKEEKGGRQGERMRGEREMSPGVPARGGEVAR